MTSSVLSFNPSKKIIYSSPGTHYFRFKNNLMGNYSPVSTTSSLLLRITAIGAGGGGGGATSNGSTVGGSGGGGGAYVQSYYTLPTASSDILTLVVGTGGTGGTGSLGSPSAFGSKGINGEDSYVYLTSSTMIVLADGGYGAEGGVTTPNSGSGGKGSLCSGSIIISGEDGYISTEVSGSAGGACYFGGSGGLINTNISSSGVLSSSWFGYNGESPGGGGGGASSFATTTTVNGGIGGHGQIIIEWQ